MSELVPSVNFDGGTLDGQESESPQGGHCLAYIQQQDGLRVAELRIPARPSASPDDAASLRARLSRMTLPERGAPSRSSHPSEELSSLDHGPMHQLSQGPKPKSGKPSAAFAARSGGGTSSQK
jgi:hypothetical protein